MSQRQSLLQLSKFTNAASMLLVVLIFYVARDVLIPMVLGVLFAFVMSPVVNWLQRRGISNTVGVVSTAGLVLAVAILGIATVGNSLSGFSEELPKYREELTKKVDSVRSMASGWGAKFTLLSKVVEEADEKVASLDGIGKPALTPENSGSKFDGSGTAKHREEKLGYGYSPRTPLYVVESSRSSVDLRSWAGGASIILGPIGTAGLVSVFGLFALLYREDLRDRIVTVVSRGNYVVTTQALNEASTRIGKYLFAQLILNVVYGIVFGIGLSLIGYLMTSSGWFPYVTLLSVMAGLVRFVPYVGPLTGAGIPILLSVLIFPGYQVVMAVAAMIVIQELVFNNVLEPWIYGSSSGVSPMAIIVAAVFWGWMWGPIGLLLATPLTVCLVVLGHYVPRFKFFSMLFGEDVQIKPSIRCYQRLLTADQFRVNEFFQSELLKQNIPDLLDNIVVPSIKLVWADQRKHAFSDEQMFQSLNLALESLNTIEGPVDESEVSLSPKQSADRLVKDQPEGLVTNGIVDSSNLFEEAPPELPRVMAIPVRHGGESLVLRSIQRHFARTVSLSIFESEDLPAQDAAIIVAENPAMVIICVVPPGGITQARYWCSSLRRSGYHGQITVACLGKFKRYDDLFVSFRKRGANGLVTSVAHLAKKIERMVVRPAPSVLSTVRQ